jgi:membrane fusion protein, heavy metal efflux system
VVPREAIVREGVETFVFTQNVNTFLRRPVKFLFLDRQQAILGADQTIAPGVFVAQSAAAQLNRMLKSQSSGVPPGYHMHADGTMHKNGED